MQFVRRAFADVFVLRIVAIVVSLTLLGVILGAVYAQSNSGYPDENDPFWDVWSQADYPVANRDVDRTWIWGPEGRSEILAEQYVDSPNGERIVWYLDKSRMEINDPHADPNHPWFVTNGLLARDLIFGHVQVGDDQFEHYGPPEINVAGDLDDPHAPTYRTFHGVMHYEPLAAGAIIVQTIDREGNVSTDETFAQYGVTTAHLEPATNHTVASVFWEFMNDTDVVYRDGQIVEDQLFENPYYATGYPLTEAYWTTVRVEGEPQHVLIQVFERRVLTYTPANAYGWKVESGNVGLHYYHWYYEILGRQTTSPTLTIAGDGSEPVSVESGNAGSCLDAFEQEFLALINEYRQQHGLHPLSNSHALNVAAHEHSNDMGERGYFDHTTPEGVSPWDRMANHGYAYNTRSAENIAAGQHSAQDVFDAWRNSHGHNENMLDPDLHVIGIGRVEVPGSEYGAYWTTKFGGHVDAAPDC